MSDNASLDVRAEPDVWIGAWPWWHRAFALAVLVAAVVTVMGPGSRPSRIAALGLLAVIVVAYGVVGRRALCGPSRSARLLAAYAVPAVGATAAMLLLTPGAFALLFILFPQLFAASPAIRIAAVPVIATLAAMTVGIARWSDPSFAASAWVQAIVQVVVIGAFAFGMGIFIERIIEQSRQRAALIDELSAARAELERAHHTAGVLAERERLAHEIHDTLAQGFTSIVLLAQAARATDGTDPTHRHLDAIEQTARENLGEARALVAELAPPALAAGSLPAAAGRLVERLGVEVGLDARLDVVGSPRLLGPERDVAMLRALQEALTNVRRHACARTVQVTLDYDAGASVVLTVADDGRGFDPNTIAAGYGLSGMRARVEQVDGHADVQSRPSGGTVVRVTVGDPGRTDRGCEPQVCADRPTMRAPT